VRGEGSTSTLLSAQFARGEIELKLETGNRNLEIQNAKIKGQIVKCDLNNSK
jgi:hypothetical protein